MYSEQEQLLMLFVCTLHSTISYYEERNKIQGRRITFGHVIKAKDVSNVMNCTLKSLKSNLLSLFKFKLHYFDE